MNYLIDRPLTRAGLLRNQQDDCMRWAFGEHYEILDIFDSHNVWNKRHGDIFILNGDELISESIYRIGKAYLDYGRTFSEKN